MIEIRENVVAETEESEVLIKSSTSKNKIINICLILLMMVLSIWREFPLARLFMDMKSLEIIDFFVIILIVYNLYKAGALEYIFRIFRLGFMILGIGPLYFIFPVNLLIAFMAISMPLMMLVFLPTMHVIVLKILNKFFS